MRSIIIQLDQAFLCLDCATIINNSRVTFVSRTYQEVFGVLRV
jgi:hypothetical protein